MSLTCRALFHSPFQFPFQLHVYPGYEPDEVTPLPQPCLAREILSTVIDAQQDLRKKVRNFSIKIEFLSTVSAIYGNFFLLSILIKVSFKREFQSFVFSKTSEDILQVWIITVCMNVYVCVHVL